MPSNTPSQQVTDKESFFMTENYGGLNLESSPMNMPFTDSPSVTNVEIEPSGKIKKRRGSKVINDLLEYTDVHIPFRLSNGVLVHVVTDGNYMKVLSDTYGNSTVLYTTGECLKEIQSVDDPDNARIRKGNYLPKRSSLVTREESVSKFHIFTRGLIPVTLYIKDIKGSFYYDNSPAAHVLYSAGMDLLDTTKPENVYFIPDGTSTWLQALTVATAGSHLVDESSLKVVPETWTYGRVIIFNWSWECDSQWRTKKHFQDELPRFNVARGVDNYQELSPEMKISLANDSTKAQLYMYNEHAIDPAFVNNYPAYILSNAIADTTAQVYALSDAAPHIAANASYVWYPTSGACMGCARQYNTTVEIGSPHVYQYGLTNIVWGGLSYVDAAYTIPANVFGWFLTKIMGVYIGGNGYLLGSTLLCQGSGITYTYATASSYATGNYFGCWELGSAGQILQSNSVGDSIYFYGFNAGAPAGCKSKDTILSYILATDRLPSSGMLGTAANYYPMKVGGWSRNFTGLYPWINWDAREFFNVSCLFQDRVILAGFELFPSVVLFGNVGNNTQMEVSNVKYSNFEVAWADNSIATSPLEIRLTMDADELITSMVQWHDSLFVGTTRKLYRIHGGQNVAVTPTNYFVDTVSTVPCAYNSMVLTNDGVTYLSDSGVYQVVIDSNSGVFKTENIGIKVRKAIRDGLDKKRLYKGLGSMAYDSINNVLYVLVGDRTSLTPRRCFVYFADKQSWVEWTLASGYFPATTVSCYDGRVFFTISETTVSDGSWNGAEYLAATLTEFNIDDNYLDLVKNSTMSDTSLNVHIKIPVPKASYTKGAFSPSGCKASFQLENPTIGTGIKTLPVSSLGYSKVTNVNDFTTGVEGTDFVFAKDNSIITASAFQDSSEAVQVEVLCETDLSPMYIKNLTTEAYIPLSSLTYNVPATSLGYHAKCSDGDAYDGKVCMYGLAYPSWWLSPAFTRNNIQNLKRMSKFYAVFENSSTVQTNDETFPSWYATPKMNLAIVQNGSRNGQISTAITDSADPFDILSTSDSGLDYYRVVYPIDGNFISFQAFVYSFDDGNWELVGYQLETDVSGKTSRKPYD